MSWLTGADRRGFMASGSQATMVAQGAGGRCTALMPAGSATMTVAFSASSNCAIHGTPGDDAYVEETVAPAPSALSLWSAPIGATSPGRDRALRNPGDVVFVPQALAKPNPKKSAETADLAAA